MEGTAVSADGRTIEFEAPLGTPLVPGGFATVGTDPPVLAQVVSAGIAVRMIEGHRHAVLEGEAHALARIPAGFAGVPIAAAPAADVSGWAEGLEADGLDVGVLVQAPDSRARLDARGLARHTFLCGQSGSGKTYTTGVLLEQIVRRTSLRLVIVDPNSDHVGLRETHEGTADDVAAAHRARAASLRIARADADQPFATDRIAMRFSNLQITGQVLALRLDTVADADEVEALLDVTAKLPASYGADDVAAAALASGTEGGRRLAMRIRTLGIDRWSLWERDPAKPVLGDVFGQGGSGMVIDTGSIDDPHVRSAVAAAALTTVWARRAERVPTLVVLDEAHNICPAEPSDPIQQLATELAILIAGEGRKYGVFLMVATQRPQKVHPSVVAGCENLVLLRMNSLRDVGEIEAIFSHVPEGLLRLAPGFVRGEALVAGPLAPVPLHLRVGGRITPEGGGDVPPTWARPPGS